MQTVVIPDAESEKPTRTNPFTSMMKHSPQTPKIDFQGLSHNEISKINDFAQKHKKCKVGVDGLINLIVYTIKRRETLNSNKYISSEFLRDIYETYKRFATLMKRFPLKIDKKTGDFKEFVDQTPNALQFFCHLLADGKAPEAPKAGKENESNAFRAFFYDVVSNRFFLEIFDKIRPFVFDASIAPPSRKQVVAPAALERIHQIRANLKASNQMNNLAADMVAALTGNSNGATKFNTFDFEAAKLASGNAVNFIKEWIIKLERSIKVIVDLTDNFRVTEVRRPSHHFKVGYKGIILPEQFGTEEEALYFHRKKYQLAIEDSLSFIRDFSRELDEHCGTWVDYNISTEIPFYIKDATNEADRIAVFLQEELNSECVTSSIDREMIIGLDILDLPLVILPILLDCLQSLSKESHVLAKSVSQMSLESIKCSVAGVVAARRKEKVLSTDEIHDVLVTLFLRQPQGGNPQELQSKWKASKVAVKSLWSSCPALKSVLDNYQEEAQSDQDQKKRTDLQHDRDVLEKIGPQNFRKSTVQPGQTRQGQYKGSLKRYADILYALYGHVSYGILLEPSNVRLFIAASLEIDISVRSSAQVGNDCNNLLAFFKLCLINEGLSLYSAQITQSVLVARHGSVRGFRRHAHTVLLNEVELFNRGELLGVSEKKYAVLWCQLRLNGLAASARDRAAKQTILQPPVDQIPQQSIADQIFSMYFFIAEEAVMFLSLLLWAHVLTGGGLRTQVQANAPADLFEAVHESASNASPLIFSLRTKEKNNNKYPIMGIQPMLYRYFAVYWYCIRRSFKNRRPAGNIEPLQLYLKPDGQVMAEPDIRLAVKKAAVTFNPLLYPCAIYSGRREFASIIKNRPDRFVEVEGNKVDIQSLHARYLGTSTRTLEENYDRSIRQLPVRLSLFIL